MRNYMEEVLFGFDVEKISRFQVSKNLEDFLGQKVVNYGLQAKFSLLDLNDCFLCV